MEGPNEGAGAPTAGGPRPSNKRLQQTQAQVDEVVGIMKVYLIYIYTSKNILGKCGEGS